MNITTFNEPFEAPIACLDFLRSEGMQPSTMRGRDRLLCAGDFQVRDKFIKRFGFAVINEKAINAIKTHAPILELGAGSGYWSYELRRVGVDVVAIDSGTGCYANFTDDPKHWQNKWTEVESIDARQAVTKYPNRNLLIVWPSYSEPWAREAIEAASPDVVIYVGEGEGGCTADDEFHAKLKADFSLKRTVAIPQFLGLHDRLMIYRRK